MSKKESSSKENKFEQGIRWNLIPFTREVHGLHYTERGHKRIYSGKPSHKYKED